MKNKNLKIIKNEYAGTDRWRKDPTIPEEEIEIFNRFLLEIGATGLVWNRKNDKPKLKIVN